MVKRLFALFEHGRAALNSFGIRPERVFDFFDALDMSISTMASWLAGGPAYSGSEFCEVVDADSEYYFLTSRRSA